jgi:hypothetical protein
MQKPEREKHADRAADDRRTAAKKPPKEEKGKDSKLARDVKRAAKPGKKADDSPGDVEIAADD